MRPTKLFVASILLLCPSLLLAGSVSGKVTFTGIPAKPKTIDMSKEPNCAKAYTTPPTTESVVTGAGNTRPQPVRIWNMLGLDNGSRTVAAVSTWAKSLTSRGGLCWAGIF